MSLTSARNVLMLSAFAAVSAATVLHAPDVLAATSPAGVGDAMKLFVRDLVIGLAVSSGLMALASRFTGERLLDLARKDERDIALGRRAYAAGFWILLIGSALMISHMGGDILRGMKCLALGFVAMFVVIIGLAARDELSLMALARPERG